MQKQTLVTLAFCGLLALSAAVSQSAYTPEELTALSSKSSDFVTKLNSTDIPNLSPGEYMIQFEDVCPGNPLFDHKNQIYFVYLPTNFKRTANVSLGIVAFISHTNQWGMWSLYKDIFDSRNLIYICPQNVGNMVEDLQRHAAGTAGLAYFQAVLPLDPTRIYVSGLSGGARIACQMGFDNGTWITGIVGICGCDYKRKVTLDSGADPSYGFYDSYPLPNDVLAANLRVAIITGTNDFLDVNLNNIYYNGIVEDGLTGWLIDVPGMGHEMADYASYDQALGYLDDNRPQCQYPCKTCRVTDRSDCTGCFESMSMSLYIADPTSKGICVQSCPDGFYSYGGLCIANCPEGTTAMNDGFRNICYGEATEESE